MTHTQRFLLSCREGQEHRFFIPSCYALGAERALLQEALRDSFLYVGGGLLQYAVSDKSAKNRGRFSRPLFLYEGQSISCDLTRF